MARVDPRHDIGESIDSRYVVLLMDKDGLDFTHQASEGLYSVFSIGHEALGHVAASALSSGGLYKPFDIGIQAYEALAGTNYSPTGEVQTGIDAATPPDADDVFSSRRAVAAFANTVTSESDFEELLDESRTVMVAEAKVLTDIITEITEAHLGHDKGAVEIALKGAATIRALHVHAATHK